MVQQRRASSRQNCALVSRSAIRTLPADLRPGDVRLDWIVEDAYVEVMFPGSLAEESATFVASLCGYCGGIALPFRCHVYGSFVRSMSRRNPAVVRRATGVPDACECVANDLARTCVRRQVEA